jgi:hypothetical protein
MSVTGGAGVLLLRSKGSTGEREANDEEYNDAVV